MLTMLATDCCWLAQILLHLVDLQRKSYLSARGFTRQSPPFKLRRNQEVAAALKRPRGSRRRATRNDSKPSCGCPSIATLIRTRRYFHNQRKNALYILLILFGQMLTHNDVKSFVKKQTKQKKRQLKNIARSKKKCQHSKSMQHSSITALYCIL